MTSVSAALYELRNVKFMHVGEEKDEWQKSEAEFVIVVKEN